MGNEKKDSEFDHRERIDHLQDKEQQCRRSTRKDKSCSASGFCSTSTWWPQLNRRDTATVLVAFVFSLVLLGALALLFGCFDTQLFGGFKPQIIPTPISKSAEFPLQCPQGNLTNTCPRDYPTTHSPKPQEGPQPNPTCPSYFRWIHEDLRPWKETGITRDMMDRARRTANFRLVIINGKAYVEKYRKSLQTRDVFTMWGILQLLRWYPGRLPDLELMFDCDDRPVVPAKSYRRPNSGPPPVFKYCGDYWSMDIIFPDWSFWGWRPIECRVETNIRPWQNVLRDIKEGNNRTKWKDRVPYAYWRGNPNVAPTRQDLLKCNVSDKIDWDTRLYIQDWQKESKRGYKQSNLEDQCTHRYKIYTEGWAWSVSEKYILACDSMTLYIKSNYHDFYIRGMVPLEHYWPIRENHKCPSLKFAVEWGNNHTHKAESIGRAGSRFIHEDLKMENVYDYMFHLLSEYGKLIRFKPTVPPAATELCSEVMACPAPNGTYRKFMLESLVVSPRDSAPCNLPPPYDPQEFRDFVDKKSMSSRQVEIWENQYWRERNLTLV